MTYVMYVLSSENVWWLSHCVLTLAPCYPLTLQGPNRVVVRPLEPPVEQAVLCFPSAWAADGFPDRGA